MKTKYYIEDLTKFIGVSRSTVDEACKDLSIEPIKEGHRYIYDREDFKHILEYHGWVLDGIKDLWSRDHIEDA